MTDSVLPKLLYTKAEAAVALSLPESSIDWLLRKKTIPRRKVAGKIRFSMEDLEAIINGSKVGHCCNPVLRQINERKVING